MTGNAPAPGGAGQDVAGEVLATSATWDAPGTPAISVMVSTWNRSGYLDDLHRTLVAQTLAADQFEVVVVDNGSADDTAEVLAALAESSPLRLAVVRLDENRGPAGGRNAAAAHCRAPLIAVTDDDCLPTPAWLIGIVASFDADDVVLVQGRVDPDPARLAEAGPWPAQEPGGEPALRRYLRKLFTLSALRARSVSGDLYERARADYLRFFAVPMLERNDVFESDWMNPG